ncbi:hypothetical protein JKF63_07617 [Porcisia hertigi]|uniref:Uncharacterized protein n=1 Tax=Porcisia hertigi TaxID=2761500 RepID=A0A836LFN8_9TRYP|nr:hypothetical protein JKF63_07617 [Porcisia hertigi]
MAPLPRLCPVVAGVWVLLALGSWVCIAAEGKVRPPYTEPVIQTSHGTAVDPESGARVSVLPVSFNVTAAEPFLKPAALLNGTQSTGKAIGPEHLFTNATLRLVFDVPNPGLDFVMNLTSARYPLIQDPNMTLWRSVLPSRIEVVKQNSKYTYDVGNLSLKSYQSKSESVEVVAGVPKGDADCYTSKGCCAVNSSHYRKYGLVDSPVPPYACTGSPIPYLLKHFTFKVDSAFRFRETPEVASCELKMNQLGEDLVACTGNSTVAMQGVAANPPYNSPSRGYSLCRRGGNLTNSASESPPIPVVGLSFCTGSQCIGYTTANHRSDRSTCKTYPLGFYTSADGNNTNQFSSFEKKAAGLWPYYFDGCRWIDDVTMSSPTEIADMSIQCDVPQSTGWSLSYERFSAHLTDTIAPLFPIGRPTRVSGQYVSSADKDTILFELEYVSFSSFKGARWTLKFCAAGQCVTSTVPAAGDTGHHPSVMRVNVSASALGLTASPQETPVSVEVYSATTPITSPFRSLLAPSVVYVEKALTPSSQDTVNMTLARDPPERVPSPYAASTSGKTTSRVLCEGDYRFSTVTNDCEPLTDKDCAIKYRGRRSKFDLATRACAYPVPPLNGPLVFKPLADPKPPRMYSPEELRAILKEVKLPQFLRTMEKSYQEYERQMAQGEGGRLTGLPPGGAAPNRGGTGVVAVAADDESDVEGNIEPDLPGVRGATIFFISATCALWTVALLRDVLSKLLGVGPWRSEPPCAFAAALRRCLGSLSEARENSQAGERPQPQGTSTAGQLPSSGNTTSSGRVDGRVDSAFNRGKGRGATFATDPLQQRTAGPRSPAAPRQTTAAASRRAREPIKTPQHERSHGGEGGRTCPPRTHDSCYARQKYQQNSPTGPTQTASPWGNAYPNASAAPLPTYHASGFTEAPHAPFGREARFAFTGAMPFLGGNYRNPYACFADTEGGLGPAPAAHPPSYSASPQQCWYNFPASPCPPPHPEPPERPSFADTRPPSPRYSRKAPSATFGGCDSFPPAFPVRQSSRVEVISDTDELHGNAGAASAPPHAGRGRRLSSLD